MISFVKTLIVKILISKKIEPINLLHELELAVNKAKPDVRKNREIIFTTSM